MKSKNYNKELSLYILVAYIFAVVLHLSWIFQMGQGNPEFIYNGSYIINTNDGYFFASGVQKELYGMHQYNELVPTIFDRGLVFFTTILAKILPFSLDTITFYMPALIATLIVVPIILIGKLYNNLLWGFLSALIASIAWSYYNRTMVGYYDSDIFSIWLLMFVVYYLLKSIKLTSLNATFIAAILMIIYKFMYHPGALVLYALSISYFFYLLIFKKDWQISLKQIILTLLALIPLPIDTPYNIIASFFLVLVAYKFLKEKEVKINTLAVIASILFLLFLFYGNIFAAILSKVNTYVETGVNKEGLKFFGVFQTIAEANPIPFFETKTTNNSVANRIIGSSIAFIVALISYIYLCYKHRAFLILIPLVGIGLFAHWGGLRFTIYAIGGMAIAISFVIIEISKQLTKDKISEIAISLILTAAILYPNITHLYNYNKYITPVFKNSEIKQLEKLKKIANPKDYTLSWWDYGYPIWYYTNTNTLIDGGKHREDNFIISKMLLSNSPQLAYNLASLSIEEYTKGIDNFKKWKEAGADKNSIAKEYNFTNSKGENYHVGNPRIPIITQLLKNKQKNQLDPNDFLAKLDSKNFNLPPKTRDIYWYMPLKAIRVIPALEQFSNLDLTTGKPLRNIYFDIKYPRAVKNGVFIFDRGFKFDTKKGIYIMPQGEVQVNKFIVANYKNSGDIELKPFAYNPNSNISILFLQNLGISVILDNKTLNSNYVKMFLLGIYDKELFELVDASLYGRVYKLKR